MATREIPHDVGRGLPRVASLRPEGAQIFFQILVIVALTMFVWWIIGSMIENLKRSKIASGFAFLNSRFGFDLSDSLIAFDSYSTYKRALLVGFLSASSIPFLWPAPTA